MRDPWVSADSTLRERLSDPGQAGGEPSEPSLPPYALSFLTHLRLLVAVPFGYLVPDPRMLPNESIRFFHLDRSWTDRLVDGTLAVGKIGTREQAHHQEAAPAITVELDELEPGVRPLQRGLAPLDQRAATAEADAGQPATGFVLRSALVSGWPHMEVRAFRQSRKLTLLRLERLSSSVLLAIFAGVADRVELEEPHHGVQFGVKGLEGRLVVLRRRADGTLSNAEDTLAPPGGSQETGNVKLPVGLRDPELGVVEIAGLRRMLSQEADQRDPFTPDHPGMPVQTGSAAFTIELLQPPWLQVFSDEASRAEPAPLRMQARPVADLAAEVDAGALADRLGGERS